MLERLGRRLGGRTLGLFTSLRRLDQVAEELAPRLRAEGIELLAPRRASDDPGALVTRFVQGAPCCSARGSSGRGSTFPATTCRRS